MEGEERCRREEAGRLEKVKEGGLSSVGGVAETREGVLGKRWRIEGGGGDEKSGGRGRAKGVVGRC
jgi:hypothetical protein